VKQYEGGESDMEIEHSIQETLDAEAKLFASGVSLFPLLLSFFVVFILSGVREMCVCA
jgi:hypothetical protein